ncbi:tRNA(His) guanylyltransferase Thg1 family protein [Acetonema longum]|uniref:tRNA(His) guanylyltransferase n=1 Tax=Acetonema longum DSM 6540 TaxID=1009370 RepID=F7NGU8_9FIRM|nr:tRNA(His) guanylyltransferase Thg1 family protein [Acetonema longum]EGO64679.1 tRNA(His)-5'-guanylyltransferase [Acetonema longum DSM 6540]
MKFSDFDIKMRVYETAHDYCVIPGVYMAARIDGRSFTRLTKEVYQFESPYDIRFRDYMVATVEHLMQCGFRVIYGYTQSDEISLLFHLDETAFGRKTRKFNSILAGEASAKFSLLLGGAASFDCRISVLPNKELVVNYFRWRYEDACRNALNAHCYWLLRRNGKTVAEANSLLLGMGVKDKNELLYQYGMNFNDVPSWQKSGIGLYWEQYEKVCENVITGQTTVPRRRIKVDDDLPLKDQYNLFIANLLDNGGSAAY